MASRFEILLSVALLTQFQWVFANLYEEVLTPNFIVASIPQINAYNRFFRITEPYYYYVPLTQLGVAILVFLSFSRATPQPLRPLIRRAALCGTAAVAVTAFIVIQYNLKMFFGDVDFLGPLIHRRHLEWALWNALRIVLVGTEAALAARAYRQFLTALPNAETAPPLPARAQKIALPRA